MENERQKILISYIEEWLAMKQGFHVREPKGDKESKGFTSSSDLREESAMACSERRLKDMNA